MRSFFKPVLIAGLLATAGFAAFSQSPMGGDHGKMMGQGGAMHEGMGMDHGRMGRMDPAKMQAMMDKRSAELKAKLKITASQEGAWTTFTSAMKPSAEMMAKRPDPAEMAKLPTPERIDKMKALHTQHMADMTTAMDKRGDATKAFYAVLTPEQQKTFDAQSMHHQGSEGKQHGPRDAKDAKAPAQPKK